MSDDGGSSWVARPLPPALAVVHARRGCRTTSAGSCVVTLLITA